MNPKVFVLGVDGATLELIIPWANEGKLPNFAKLLQEGRSGELESTIPPVTAPAWTSFFTGKNPGKHGMFDFITPNCETNNLSYLSSEDCESETIWSILSEKGKKVCVVNVPMTYPPHSVNGILVSGMAPGLDCEFVYPHNLQKEIMRKFPDYIMLARPDKDPRRFLRDIKKMTRVRAELTKYLLTRKEWDFFMVVFNATDIVQHRFWGYMDEERGSNNKYANAILDVYRLIDQKIGELRSCLDDNTLFLLMSDHGAGAWDWHVHLNTWLEEKGYLEFKDFTEGRGFSNPLRALRKTAKKTLIDAFIFWNNRVPSHIRNKVRRSIPGIENLGAFERVESVMNAQFNWSKTKAYHVGTYANIRINLKGREVQGIVEPGEEYEALKDQLVNELTDLREPKTGERLIEKIFKREEIYHGEAWDKAPDLIIKWAKENYWSGARFGARGSKVFESHEGKLDPLVTTGTHRLNGVLIASGKMIDSHFPKTSKDARFTTPPTSKDARFTIPKIIDLAPTILYAMGLPIPTDMDGKPLVDLFAEEFQETVKYEDRDLVHKKHGEGVEKVFSQDDERKIEERLKGIGYLG